MDKTEKKPEGWTHRHTFLFGLALVVILIFVLDRKYSTQIPTPTEPAGPHEPRKDPAVVLQVLTDADAAVAGKEFSVGFLLKIKPGWHIYGPEPGDAGAPTEVVFLKDNPLPAAKVLYPAAKTFHEPGDITVYGYETEVMLVAKFQMPASPEKQSLIMAGTVSWLACREVCVPGEQEFRVELPVKEVAHPRHTEAFSYWKQRIAEAVGNPSKP